MTLDDPVLIKVLSDEMEVYRLFLITMALHAVVDGCIVFIILYVYIESVVHVQLIFL